MIRQIDAFILLAREKGLPWKQIADHVKVAERTAIRRFKKIQALCQDNGIDYLSFVPSSDDLSEIEKSALELEKVIKSALSQTSDEDDNLRHDDQKSSKSSVLSAAIDRAKSVVYERDLEDDGEEYDRQDKKSDDKVTFAILVAVGLIGLGIILSIR